MWLTECKGYDYKSLKELENVLCKEYGFLKKGTIGRSCGGREISSLKLGNCEEYALITAAFHGMEYITTTVLMMFVERLCYAIKTGGSIAGFDAVKAMYGRGVIFVPCVNPDGCEIVLCGKSACVGLENMIGRICNNNFEIWNANLKGVDINHNFNAGWDELHNLEQKAGICGPAPTRFGGFYPESEPETLALTELCRTKRIRHVVALHSQGEVIYWKYGEFNPPKAEKMAEIMATSSGYRMETPDGLAVGGGFKDWFISEFNRPGFTIELGLGKNPLPINTAKEIYERVSEMLMLAVIM